MKKKLEKLEAIINAGKVTADDRLFIRSLSDELGITFKPRPNCKDCYKDQAVIIHKKIKDLTPSAFDGRKWRMRDGVDVIYHGRRVNDDLLTDEVAEEMIASGHPLHWFYESRKEDTVH